MNEQTKKRALRLLDKRDYARRELIDKLVEKGEAAEDAEAVADRFVELGLINDARYGSLVVRHYAAKGYGVNRIRAELNRRGLPRELWDEALASMPAQDDTVDRFLRSRLKGNFDQKDVKRVSDALVRRGFSWDEIKSALNRYRSELEE